MTRRVKQVYTAAAVLKVDLPRTCPLRIGSMFQPALCDAHIDAIKACVVDQECVVLCRDINGLLRKSQHYTPSASYALANGCLPSAVPAEVARLFRLGANHGGTR